MGFFRSVTNLMSGRNRKAPTRDTETYPRLMQIGQAMRQKAQMKPTPPNIRYFSRTPYARAAIRTIREPLTQFAWEIVPKKDVKLNSELERQIEIATHCLSRPNKEDSFHSMLGLLIEDFLVFGSAVIEKQISGDMMRPLWMWPVDSQSIQIFPCWSGDKNEARYIQTLGFTNVGIFEGRKLRNDEIIYIRDNSSTETPYGYGMLEIAFATINRQLGVADYAGNLASNAQPLSILYLGSYSTADIRAFRDYWRNEIEGQGLMPIIGGNGQSEPKSIPLHEGTDNALYLKYQEFIIREIATTFGISPQNLGLEADVNRNTAEVGADRDLDRVIKPIAKLFAESLTRHALHGALGWHQIEFKFVGLDREDEEATAKIYETYYKGNAITPNEQRARLGLEPMDNQWGNLVYADTQIALSAARGVGQVDDKDLSINNRKKQKKK
jgi:hypothetical protein